MSINQATRSAVKFSRESSEHAQYCFDGIFGQGEVSFYIRLDDEAVVFEIELTGSIYVGSAVIRLRGVVRSRKEDFSWRVRLKDHILAEQAVSRLEKTLATSKNEECARQMLFLECPRSSAPL